MPKLDSFRRHCRALRRVATGVFVCLALILALPYLLFPLAHVVMQEAATASDQRQLLLALVQVSPGVCYLGALWAMRRALGDLSTGQLFQPTVALALRQIGGGVIAGALISIFAVTNISRMIVHGRGGFAYFDMSGIVLAMVGAALILLARLVEQARRLESELDDMI
jgi:hypothetical protein